MTKRLFFHKFLKKRRFFKIQGTFFWDDRLFQ